MKKANAHFRFLTASLLLGAALLGGCSREESKGASAGTPSPVAPEVYMKDQAFREKLAERGSSRRALAKSRSTVVARMVEMIEAKKKELGTSDEAVLKAALEKDPEWRSLYARCVDANTALAENGRETMKVVRERLTKAPETGSK
jgi:hypothetical protein